MNLHAGKGGDYGTNEDPYINFKEGIEIGVAPWVMAFLRLSEKTRRLKVGIKKGKLTYEGFSDTFMDIAAIAIICSILWEDEFGPAHN